MKFLKERSASKGGLKINMPGKDRMKSQYMAGMMLNICYRSILSVNAGSMQ